MRDDRTRLDELVATQAAEIERLSKEVAEKHKELQRFTSIASHDLQAPVRAVISYLDLMLDQYGERLDERGRTWAEAALAAGTRMQQMIFGLLAFSRVETRAKPSQPTNCRELFDRVVKGELAARIRETRAEIEVGELPTVQADPAQLIQVFLHLLDNALKFIGEDPPRLSVGAERYGRGWRFHVRDNGIGIGPDEAERVFELFGRLHGRGEYPGAGLGMALCRRIIERHGGRMWFESEPGEGTVFYFSLPDL